MNLQVYLNKDCPGTLPWLVRVAAWRAAPASGFFCTSPNCIQTQALFCSTSLFRDGKIRLVYVCLLHSPYFALMSLHGRVREVKPKGTKLSLGLTVSGRLMVWRLRALDLTGLSS